LVSVFCVVAVGDVVLDARLFGVTAITRGNSIPTKMTIAITPIAYKKIALELGHACFKSGFMVYMLPRFNENLEYRR
jgi:hypothetical protein